MERLTIEGGKLAVALGLILALVMPVAAQDFQFADPATNAWAGQVRDRLATRDSLESVYSRANARLAQDQASLNQIAAARPNPGETAAAFQQRVGYQQSQIRQDMINTQSLVVRTQQRLSPIYTALQKDYAYANSCQDPAVRQSVGSLIAAAGHGLDPIWIHTPPVVVPTGGAASLAGADPAVPAGATGVTDPAVTANPATGAGASTAPAVTGSQTVATAAAGDQGQQQAISNSMMLNGPAQNVPPASSAASDVNAAAATATGSPQAIWTMEADPATGVMQMHARDASTMERLADVAPLPTKINTGADATAVAPEAGAQAANSTLGQLRRTAWVAETGSDGNTVFRAVDWKSHAPLDNVQTVTGEGTTPLAAAPAAPAGSATVAEANAPTGAGAATAAAPAAKSVSDYTSAVWTAEPNPQTGLMVLRAHDPVTNNHLAGFQPVETDMPIPAGGHSDGVTATRSTFKSVTYTASHDPATNQLTFTPAAKNGGELPSDVKTVTAAAPEDTNAAASDVNTAQAESQAADATAAAGKPKFQMPSAGAVASSAAKWGGLSIGVTLASNVADQFIKNNGKVNWGQATQFLSDPHFWGGTAGGFVGSMAGGALAAFVPGGTFVKAALSIGGAALGYQVGSGQAGKTDWVGLGVTTLGAAAGTALGATMGPVGALVGGVAGQMVSQLIYDKIKEMRNQGPTSQMAALAPPTPGKSVPYLPPQLPVGQLPAPGQIPVTQVPSQMPTQIPGQMPSQFPGQIPSQIPVGQANLGTYGPSGGYAPPAGILAGPPGAQNYGSATNLTQQMARVYQAKLAADQSGNAQLSNQYLLQYQAMSRQLAALRQGAYANGGYGDYRVSR